MKRVTLGKRCMSAGVLVAAAFDHRVAHRDSQILLHLCGSVPDSRERWTVREHLESARRISLLDNEMLNVLAYQTGADLDTLMQEAITEEPLPVDRAKAIGLIHEIVERPAS